MCGSVVSARWYAGSHVAISMVNLDHECIAHCISVLSQNVVCWPQDTSVTQSSSRSIVSLQKVRKRIMDRSIDR